MQNNESSRSALVAASLLVWLNFVALPCAAIDWTKSGGRDVVLFQPGQSSWEWMLAPDRHAGAPMVKQGRNCRLCHTGQESVLGNKIIADKSLEPRPLPLVPGALTVNIKTAHDGERLYFRVTWPATALIDSVPMDPQVQTKLSLIFDDGESTAAAHAGCWATCHSDNSAMANASIGTEMTKYLDESRTEMGPAGGGEAYKSEAELASLRQSGVFLEYWQVDMNPGAEANAADGYILDKRHPFPGPVIKAIATFAEGSWTVTVSRPLVTGDPLRKDIIVGKPYSFGIAIHEHYTSGRYHYVSFEHTFIVDKGAADFIVVQ